jgi:septum site-determining protein MinC
MLQLKGKRPGIFLCVVPEDMPEEALLEGLDRMVYTSKKFLTGSRVIMDMQGRRVNLSLVAKITERFAVPADCKIMSWMVLHAESQEFLKRCGLALGEPKLTLMSAEEAATAPGLLFTGTLRGGQRLEHDGDVIITGHANTGSEIAASGHVVVLGWLKGTVHAGCRGDESMSICARSFESEQVKIAGLTGVADRSTRLWGKPAVVTAGKNELLIADWPLV